MKERIPERREVFRNYLVCYDGYRQIGWRNVAELHELLNEGKVNWYMEKGKDRVNVNIEIPAWQRNKK